MLLLLASLAFAPPAFAQSSPTPEEVEQAKQLFRNGADLYDEGRYEDAIAAWQEAYNLSKQPVLLFNIANAYERLGRYQESYDALNRYRAFAPESEREAIERRLVNLEARLKEQPTTTTPATTPEPKPEKERSALLIPVAFYGAGVAGLAVGTGFGLRANGARDEAASLCAATDTSAVCPDSAAGAISRDRSSSHIADVGFAVGAVGLVGGTALMFMGRSEEGVSVAPTANGFVVSARF